MLSIHHNHHNTLIPSANIPISIIQVFLGTLLLAVSAKVQIPFFPVPLTMQTFVVLLIGFCLGARLGLITMLAYLAEGAMGMPVFAGTPEKGIGLAYMMGTTGGYLLGFVVAALIVGMLAERRWDRYFPTALIASLLGLVAIYIPGIIWLGMVVGWDKPILEWGLWPFLPGEIFKLMLLAVALPFAWKFIPNRSNEGS